MGVRVTRVGTLVLSALVSALCVLLPAGPAAAHNSLTGSDPRAGARLAKAPTSVRLSFLSRLDPATTRVTVTGPDNVDAAAGKPAFAGSRVTMPVRPGAAGLYIVQYQIASSDGHPIKGEIRFTLTVGAAPSGSPPANGPTPAASASSSGLPASPSSPPPTAGPLTPAADSADPVWWPWVLGAALVLAALVGGLLLRRRTSARSGPAS